VSDPNHPKHFGDGKLRIDEVVDEWDLNFYDGNAVKYILCAKFQDKEIQDIEKALEYLKHHLKVRKEAYDREYEEQTATWRPGCGNYIVHNSGSSD